MSNNDQHTRNTRALGILLLGVGVWVLLSQFLHIDIGSWLWPFWIIIPGIVIIALGFREPGRGNEGLVTFGSIVAMTGIILFVQNLTEQWQSWAYAWTLLFPGAIGIGKYLWGKHAGDSAAVRSGEKTIQTAVVLFLASGAFFELVLGIGGFHLGSVGRIIIPVLLIAAGVAIYATSVTDRRSGMSSPPPTAQPPQSPIEDKAMQDQVDHES